MSRPPRSTHGDYGYAKRWKCQCDPCAYARNRYVKQRALDKHRGVVARLDPTPTRTKLEVLLELGAERAQIARAAGISPTVIKNVLGTHGRSPAKWVLRPTAAKIDALTLDDVLTQFTWVPALGVHRRINALRAWGYRNEDIGIAVGVSGSQIYHYLESTIVSTNSLAAVDRVYRNLRERQGDCPRSLWRGMRENAPIPMCWDDETIDDPKAKPHPRRCVVLGCGRSAQLASLCEAHYVDCSKRGGIGNRKARYREVVIALSRRRNVDSATMRASVAECLNVHGLSVDSTAHQLGVSRDFIDKVKKELSSAAR